MSHNHFLISDTHFGHESTCTKFKNDDGSPLRPFANAQEMDETLVENWNRVVSPKDVVYHLGDVVIARRNLVILNRLNGRKRLVRGNHDVFKLTDYTKYFEDIFGVKVLSDMILSHIPLARESIGERFQTNVHGHTHGNIVKRNDLPDPMYFSVCVEQINYTPISLEDARKKIAERKAFYKEMIAVV